MLKRSFESYYNGRCYIATLSCIKCIFIACARVRALFHPLMYRAKSLSRTLAPSLRQLTNYSGMPATIRTHWKKIGAAIWVGRLQQCSLCRTRTSAKYISSCYRYICMYIYHRLRAKRGRFSPAAARDFSRSVSFITRARRVAFIFGERCGESLVLLWRGWDVDV